MGMGLAEMWWDRLRDLPQENKEQLRAHDALANALLCERKSAPAEAMCREPLLTRHRVLGAEHPAPPLR